MADTILVFDVGLTNCKSIILGVDGSVRARASVGYRTDSPQRGWVQQEPESWWSALAVGTDEIRTVDPGALERVVAIGVTGHMHALVPTGSDGCAIGPVMVLGDQRSLGEAQEITDELGLERIYDITGARMDASMPVAKLRWLGRHAPEVHARARSFLACKDWIRHRLTGDLLTDPVDACGTSLYDIRRASWAPDLVALAGVRADQLPALSDPCQVAGRLLPGPAREMGLKEGIPVVVGAGDDVEVLGNGLMGPGRSLEHLGTTGSILTCSSHPVYDPQMAVELYPHVVPGLWVLGGSVTAAGSALAWADGMLRPAAGGVAERPPGPRLDQPLVFLPHLLGQRCPDWNPLARGAWVGLSMSHTPHDLRQSVHQGVAFSLKSVLERIEALVGRQERIVVGGGAGGTEDWLKQRASIYGRPLALLATAEPTALGAMIVAAVGVGLFDTVGEGVSEVTRVDRIVDPSPDLVTGYDQLYGLYRAAASTLPQVTGQGADHNAGPD